MNSIGISAVGVCVPSQIRTNDYYWNHPSPGVQRMLQVGVGKIWNRPSDEEEDAFSIEMKPYLNDPFRGSIERRIMRTGQTTLSLEVQAARNAMQAAKLTPSDIDLIIVTSMIPDQIGVGNAAFLAKELGTRCPAFNQESACASGIIALQSATALIAQGYYRNALIVQSCNYCQTANDDDPTTWFCGDGAGALIVESLNDGDGFLGFTVVPTTDTCGVVIHRINERKTDTDPLFVMESQRGAGKILHQTSEPYLRTCCEAVLAKLGLSVPDINFFVFSTPTAWYSAFGARVLCVPLERTISTHERFGNVGPAMLPVNLHAAITENRIKKGDLVLLYQIGSVSNAAAAVMRWSNVKSVYSEL